jgi:hypothetical protein
MPRSLPIPSASRASPKAARTAHRRLDQSTKKGGNAQQPVIELTRATARLPGLDIEIIHRRSPSGDAEQISINLQAVPSFEAFGRFVESANPFAFWPKAVQMVWLPWLAVLPRSLPLPLVGPEVVFRRRPGEWPDGLRSREP